ncbi:hypothetical protein [Pedobacter sp. FW305-3-2-15-E-R2A2]|uniref:hypothetical protein n=1 Tax=Pedobacter sp. FW305-3-2-15-E-R2A2 TaxID=3140251 RepID=UPI0031402ADE
MLNNNSNPKGHQKLDRNALKKVTGGGRIDSCPGNCTHRVGSVLVPGCLPDQQCLGYLCSNGWWASVCG